MPCDHSLILDVLPLVNLVEDHHRVRVLREREEKFAEINEKEKPKKPLASRNLHMILVFTLKKSGLSLEDTLAFFSQLRLELVFTAHPNEARRRTILEKTFRISRLLMNLETTSGITPLERKQLLLQMRAHIASLWQTDEVQNRDLTVMDEVKIGLYYMKEVVFPMIPIVYSRFEDALMQAYGKPIQLAPFVYYGTWRGSDRDGNPNVTPELTEEAAKWMRKSVIELYDEKLFDFTDNYRSRYTLPVSARNSLNRLRQKRNCDRTSGRKLRSQIVTSRHRETDVYAQSAHCNTERKQPTRYDSSSQFLIDLRMIYNSLAENKSDVTARAFVLPLLRQTETFGFEFASMDIRQHSAKHEKIVSVILEHNDITGYSKLEESEKSRLLTELIDSDRELKIPTIWNDLESEEHFEVFRMIKRVHDDCSTEQRSRPT